MKPKLALDGGRKAVAKLGPHPTKLGWEELAEHYLAATRIEEIAFLAKKLGAKRVGIAYCIGLAEEARWVCLYFEKYFEVHSVCCKVGGTDLNVVVGLCAGHDSQFYMSSVSPVVTLAAKDRVLAHNPLGAVYSRYQREARLGIHIDEE